MDWNIYIERNADEANFMEIHPDKQKIEGFIIK